jgi:hypothetical protein
MIQTEAYTSFVWSSLIDIDGYAIGNEAIQAVRAAYNWWNSSTGSTAVDNLGGIGSALYGTVLYRPFLTSLESKFIFMPLAIRSPGR